MKHALPIALVLLSAATEATYAHFFPQMVEDIRAWMDGTPIRVLPPQAHG